MAVNGEITLPAWGDGEHKFNVAKIRCILELEEKCGVGVSEIYSRITNGKWKFNDIRETLRLGLIGGGMNPDQALKLIQRYVDDRPWMENLLPAQAVLIAAMVGVTGDDVGKKAETERATEETPSTPTDDSSAPSSTESARRFISHPVS